MFVLSDPLLLMYLMWFIMLQEGCLLPSLDFRFQVVSVLKERLVEGSERKLVSHILFCFLLTTTL